MSLTSSISNYLRYKGYSITRKLKEKYEDYYEKEY